MRVALSLSASPDFAERGLTEKDVADLVSAVVRTITAAGGIVVFCPRLPLAGWSLTILGSVQTRNAMRPALEFVVPELEYARASRSELRDAIDRCARAGSVRFISSAGAEVSLDDLTFTGGDVTDAEALTVLRTLIARETVARIAIGGRPASEADSEAGVAQECRLTLENGGIVIPVGGFGGVSETIGRALLSQLATDEKTASVLAHSRDPEVIAPAIAGVLARRQVISRD